MDQLLTYQLDLFKIPLVMQYNKIDLKSTKISILPSQIMQKDLNSIIKAPAFEASALKGGNVIPTLKKITSMSLASIQDQLF